MPTIIVIVTAKDENYCWIFEQIYDGIMASQGIS